MFGKIALGTLGLAVMLITGAWLSTRFLVTQEVPLPEATAQRQQASFFEYVVAAEPGHIRVSGTTTFPNGVILVGTLDRIGSGPIEVKEALVMNRLFALEFGPSYLCSTTCMVPKMLFKQGYTALASNSIQPNNRRSPKNLFCVGRKPDLRQCPAVVHGKLIRR